MDALNQNEENNVKNVFKSNDAFLESDVDEQLIITVPFSQRKLLLLVIRWMIMIIRRGKGRIKYFSLLYSLYLYSRENPFH